MSATATVSVRTLFSPFDDTTTAFLDFIQTATKSISVVIYGFHLAKLTDALIAKQQAGVRVSLILDHSQSAGVAERSEVARLKAAGVPFLIGASPVHRQILHSKFTVIDDARVEHGSWNYSLSAAQQSNTMTFVDDPQYAQAFVRHHDRLVAFIRLHEMVYQEGQTLAVAEDPATPADDASVAASVAATPPARPSARRSA